MLGAHVPELVRIASDSEAHHVLVKTYYSPYNIRCAGKFVGGECIEASRSDLNMKQGVRKNISHCKAPRHCSHRSCVDETEKVYIIKGPRRNNKDDHASATGVRASLFMNG